MDKKKLEIIAREYASSVEKLLNSQENKDFLGKVVLEYIKNSSEFFKSKSMDFNTEDEFIMFVKANGSHHINETFSAIVNYFLDNLKPTKFH